ncbi:MAG: exosortase [Candidatus Latescibacteria bacterium]|nr:exosortase [Candidatus Latescibacterota bacterium]NIO00952.1 exosortase [Candidatus Latescibacterota bacterium]NIO27351.1 exosortase [Candidatus Latescibacterota bacterium]NIO54873.1 exosortase [Candidatus Latescibacterota bacterium]NIT00962.1 exosortase [Candidatus Latescibacterota bacterium]
MECSQRFSRQPRGWVDSLPLIGVGTLLFVLYLPVLHALLAQWLDDSNYRHGLLIPVISGIVLYRRREVLKDARSGGGTTTGIALIIAACVLLLAGTAASELFTMRLSIPTFLIGLALFLRGWEFTRKAAFPLLFLYMMIPLPYIIYYKITFPLQIMSAKLSSGILEILHVSILRRGNILLLPNYTLEVVAACSGLRSLMTMVTLSLILALFSDISLTRRIVLVLCAVPAAFMANTLRLVVTALGAYTVGPDFADGILHQISGLIVFLTGLILLVVALGILRKIR